MVFCAFLLSFMLFANHYCFLFCFCCLFLLFWSIIIIIINRVETSSTCAGLSFGISHTRTCSSYIIIIITSHFTPTNIFLYLFLLTFFHSLFDNLITDTVQIFSILTNRCNHIKFEKDLLKNSEIINKIHIV